MNNPFHGTKRVSEGRIGDLYTNAGLYVIWAEGLHYTKGDAVTQYNHIEFDYDSEKVDFFLPEIKTKSVFWDLDKMACFEPVDFIAEGKNGHYVTNIIYYQRFFDTKE